jgi:hypothetical protein
LERAIRSRPGGRVCAARVHLLGAVQPIARSSRDG